MSDGGMFGTWGDEDGDFFELTRPSGDSVDSCSAILPEGGWDQLWHQIGSPGITATAHANGGVTLWATDRQMVRLTNAGPQGRFLIRQDVFGDHRSRVNCARWEHSAASWLVEDGPACVRRRVASAPDDSATLVVTVSLETSGDGGRTPRGWTENWKPEPYPLLVGGLMARRIPPPPDYGMLDAAAWRALYRVSDLSRRTTDLVRRVLARRIQYRPTISHELSAVIWTPRRVITPAAPSRPAWYDEHLPFIVVAGVGEGWDLSGDSLSCELEEGRTECLVVLLLDDLDTVADRVRCAGELAADKSKCRTASRIEPQLPGHSWLERETRWHATYLRGALQSDSFFDRRYVSQGSAYAYIHGLHGAPRDYAIFAAALTYLDPAAAREQLEVIMRMTNESGAIEYAHTGRGMCTSGGIHASPTDLPLFLLWAATEYVWATGDRSWLDCRVPFRRERRARETDSTVLDRILLAWYRLRDNIGTGPNGMVRVGSGDWADPISAMVPDRRAFHRLGESAFNTAFASYVLPRAADLVADTNPAVAGEMAAWAAERADALARTWTGRWFLRGTDGSGGHVGRDHLFLDSNALCLLGRIGTPEQREVLVTEISERCITPSPIGATILDRPHRVRLGMLAPGWDCNGGVWAAVNAFATMGLALHDPALAWELVARQSLHQHAIAYPNVWYGIWSGPDAYNSHHGTRPGETFVQPATPMTEYPIMNANAHAGPLLALMASLGVRTTASGVTVEPAPEPVPQNWSLHTAIGTIGPTGVIRP